MGQGCLLLAASSLVSLGLAELAVRALGHRPLALHADRKTFWVHDPMLGWHHRPGQAGTFVLGGIRVEVRHNQRGLRDHDHPYPRVDGKKRILVIGDSFVWGYGVGQDESFAERMEKTLGDVEVINAGVSGYSTDQELLWLQDEGMKYRPDLVILVLSGNDDAMNRRRVAYFVYPKPAFRFGQEGELVLDNVPIPRASALRRIAHLGSSRSALINLGVGRGAAVLRGSRSEPELEESGLETSGAVESKPFALTAALVDEIGAVAAAGGARLLVAATGMFWPPDSVGTYPQLIATLEQQGHEIVDVESSPGFVEERMRLPNDGHWNPEGHAFVAARLLDAIEDRELLMISPAR